MLLRVARIWQTSLLLGGIGFCWDTLVYWMQLYITVVWLDDIINIIGVLTYFGKVLANFIVPIVQIASLIYDIYNVNKHVYVNQSPLLASRKRSAVVHFICTALLLIAIDPTMMTHIISQVGAQRAGGSGDLHHDLHHVLLTNQLHIVVGLVTGRRKMVMVGRLVAVSFIKRSSARLKCKKLLITFV